MCGIIGYAGTQKAVPILLDGLARLEYRGYDSAGIALFEPEGIDVIKAKGKLGELKKLILESAEKSSFSGVGHTRWATHGEPGYFNAHPHLSRSGRFAVVHNGIIENYLEIKEKLMAENYVFLSQTDTEVIAHLFEYYYDGDMIDALFKVRRKLEGSYALGILDASHPDTIFAVRKDSPLVVSKCEHGSLMASDAAALLQYTRDFYELSEKEIAVLDKSGVRFFDEDKNEIVKTTYRVDWEADSASLGGYEHFMIKEIFEQPKVLRDTISPCIRGGEIKFGGFDPSAEELARFDRFFIIGCGSAYHAGVVGKYAIEQLARFSCETALASEFRYQNPIIGKNSLIVVVSQSGETADSLAALRYAKSKGASTLAIVNVVGSAIAKEADYVIYTGAGPEISVATTKAYSCQLAVFYMLAIFLGRRAGIIDDAQNAALVTELKTIPQKAEHVLAQKDAVQYFASRHYNAKNIFFIGRNMDYAAAMEASLKLKEISYIHSEAYAAGEMKHGTIALIEQGTPVTAIAATERMFDKLCSNILEVKARGAEVLALTWEGNKKIDSVADFAFFVPKASDIFTPSLTIIPLQLFAYYVASMKGLDIDKPRNLAKSVTVE